MQILFNEYILLKISLDISSINSLFEILQEKQIS